jgi:HK97 family phage major capsid protein
MTKIAELQQERFGLAKQAEAILKEAGDKELTAEARSKFDKIMEDADKKDAEVRELQRHGVKVEELKTMLADMEKPVGNRIVENIGTDENRSGPEYEVSAVLPDDANALIKKRAYMAIRDTGFLPDKRNGHQYRKAFKSYLAATNAGDEARALQMDLDIQGGYTVVPQLFVAELIEAIKYSFFVRGIAKTYLVPNADTLGTPSLDARPADPTWTAEILTGSEDSTMAFGKRELKPHPLAQLLKVSKKLIRASALNVDQVVRDQLAYKLGYVEENAFLNGTGALQPLGVFTASNAGIGTGQDVSTGNTATTIGADGLIEAKFTLRPPYWNRSKWIFHYSALKQIRKLRGNDGDFLWQAGLQEGQPDRLLGMPVLVSELAPSTFTTGLYVGILGCFDYYYIADALDMTIQVLTELYAATNQNGYITRKETDGMPVLAEAFVRVKLA